MKKFPLAGDLRIPGLSVNSEGVKDVYTYMERM
jgi:hypothetical protein